MHDSSSAGVGPLSEPPSLGEKQFQTQGSITLLPFPCAPRKTVALSTWGPWASRASWTADVQAADFEPPLLEDALAPAFLLRGSCSVVVFH